ncbi:MAG: serine hydrolase, partial [Lachnospiraceae bacterium]|nr:serine hydrolase [Lachnospiraceae bacterium]
LNKLDGIISNYGQSTSFYIVSLSDGMTVGYNVDRQFETASSIKAPYAFWVYREITNGNIDPNQLITYRERYFNEGTGVVKFSPFGTQFTVKELVYYSLNDSDNIAHMLLHGTFGVNGYNAMLRDLGTKQLYLSPGGPWGFTSARSAAIIWQAIYNYSLESPDGIEFLNILSNGKYNYYKVVMPDIPSASKTGFAKRDVVETGIVFDQRRPYIAIAMANKGGTISAYSEVLKLIGCMDDIMTEYDAYLGQ